MQANSILIYRLAPKLTQWQDGITASAVLMILFLLLGVPLTEADELKQATLQSWDSYARAVKANMQERATGRRQFLWVDESPDLTRRVRGGEALVSSQGPVKVPHGLIHHWAGAIFLPGVTLDEVAGVLNQYDRYQDFYRPMVMKSKVLESSDDHVRASLLMMQKAFGVTAAVETETEIHISKLDANRMYSLSDSTRVQEIAEYGQPHEHPFPEGREPGYVWRTFNVTRLEERDGGVYVEMETIALSRGIPWELRWIIEPLTDNLPRNIMRDTLKDTRIAVTEEIEAALNKEQKKVQNNEHK